MTQEFLDFVDKMTPDLPEEETSQETTSLTEEEQRENLEALYEAITEAQRKIREGIIKVRPARPVETHI